MNRFLSFDDSGSNTATYQPSYNDSANDPASDPASDVDVGIDDKANENSIIIQNISSVPNLTSFLGDIHVSGTITSTDLVISGGNIILNGKILSSSSSSSSTGSTDLTLLEERLDSIQSQLDLFVNQDLINELDEKVDFLSFQNEANAEISSLKISLLNLEAKFNALTNS
jgi:hypothetical protein